MIAPLLLLVMGIRLLAGFSDKEVIANLNDEERALLDETFADATDILVAARGMAADLGIDAGQISEIFPDIVQRQEVTVGGQASILAPDGSQLNGTLSSNPNGQFFLNIAGIGEEGKGAPGFVNDFQIPVEQVNGQFLAIGPDGRTIGELTGSFRSTADVLGDVSSTLQGFIPEGLSGEELVGQIGDPLGGQDPFEVLTELDEFSRKQFGLDQIDPESLIPDRLPDPDVFETEQRAALFGREEELVDQGRTAAQRGLVEAGILPSSAAFGFETNRAPQLASEGRIAETLPQIAQGAEEIAGRNAEIEAGARATAAGLNTQIAGIRTDFVRGTQDFVSGISAQQITVDQARVNASLQGFASQLEVFGAEKSVIEFALNQFNIDQELQAQLGVQGMEIAMTIVLGIIQAELAHNPSVVLDTDLIDGAVTTALSILQAGQGLSAFKGSSPASLA